MAGVLNGFLRYQRVRDAAFASFSRRRSTVREDIDQHFMSDIEIAESESRKSPAGFAASQQASDLGSSYLDFLNEDSGAEEPAEKAVEKAPARGGRQAKSTPSKGIVDNAPRRRGRPKAQDDGLKSL